MDDWSFLSKILFTLSQRTFLLSEAMNRNTSTMSASTLPLSGLQKKEVSASWNVFYQTVQGPVCTTHKHILKVPDADFSLIPRSASRCATMGHLLSTPLWGVLGMDIWWWTVHPHSLCNAPHGSQPLQWGVARSLQLGPPALPRDCFASKRSHSRTFVWHTGAGWCRVCMCHVASSPWPAPPWVPFGFGTWLPIPIIHDR